MSALAHMIESRGIAAVAIGLVRQHLETTRAPRALYVPFPLGRPLGEPGDAAFQRRVLLHALGLLERRDGPVILEDFPDDAPNSRDLPGWAPPFVMPAISVAGWEDGLRAELAMLQPWYLRAQARFGRTTVGLSGMAPQTWPAFVAAFLNGEVPQAPGPHSPSLTLRYVADDLKAFMLESVQAEGAPASNRQLSSWLFAETVAGRMLVALQRLAATSEHKGLQMVSRFLVPAPYQQR